MFDIINKKIFACGLGALLALSGGCMGLSRPVADSAYIQGIVNMIPEEGGGYVDLDNGIYRIDSTIVLHSGVMIAGKGKGTVLKVAPEFVGPIFTNKDLKKGNEGISIANMKLTGNGKTEMAIFLTRARGSAIQNVSFGNFPGKAVSLEHCDGIKVAASSFENCAHKEKAALFLTQTSNCLIAENKFNNCLAGGIALFDSSKNVIDGNVIKDSAKEDGINLQDSSNNLIENNLIEAPGKNGVYLRGSVKENIILGNTIENPQGSGINLLNAPDCRIIRNIVRGSNAKKLKMQSAIVLENSDNVLVQSNFLEDNNSPGILANNSKGVSLLFNVFLNNLGKSIILKKSSLRLKALNGTPSDK